MVPHHVIQAITSEGIAQGPYVAAKGGVEPAIFHTKGTDHHNSTTHALKLNIEYTKMVLTMALNP